jgi:predicted Fe-Mo cluster-binding NifX family protein
MMGSLQNGSCQKGRTDHFGFGDRQEKPLPPETKVFSRLDGESGTILNQVGRGAYEVMTDDGIEVWQEDDVQAVED